MLESAIVTALQPGQFLLQVLVLLPQLLKLCLKVLNRPFKLADASVGIGRRLLSRCEHGGNQRHHAKKRADSRPYHLMPDSKWGLPSAPGAPCTQFTCSPLFDRSRFSVRR